MLGWIKTQKHTDQTHPMEITDFPVVTEEFLKALEKMYPRTPYDWTTSSRQIYFEAGQQDVLRFLKQVVDEQRKTMM